MKTYLAKTFSDEEGSNAVEGKTIYINASKEQIKELSVFLSKVTEYVENNDNCHMHFRDYERNWNKEKYIDLAIDLIK